MSMSIDDIKAMTPSAIVRCFYCGRDLRREEASWVWWRDEQDNDMAEPAHYQCAVIRDDASDRTPDPES